MITTQLKNRLALSLSLSTIALALVLSSTGALAQTYPNRPLRLVVPFAPGGGADIVARALATPLSKRLGQSVLVDNKPGGGATIGADFVAKAPADGYTLLYTTPGVQMTNPYLMAKLPYDPVTDLVTVSQLAVVPSVLVVHKSLPVENVKELIQYARANPGKLTFASPGIGSTAHLAGELFKHTTKIDIVHVPYRGSGQALQDLVGGNVSMAIDSLAVYQPYIDSGMLKPLGVSSKERSPTLPNVRPIADDLPGFDASPTNYITVRGGTSKEIIDRLNREINAVISSAEFKNYLLGKGVVPKGSTPEEMTALVQTEAVKWKQVIQISGARAE